MPTLPNLNPTPRTGSGAYGAVPGAISAPSSSYAQVGNVLPALPNLTQSAGDVVGAQLEGQLSPGTVSFLQDKAAQFGIQMGMPGMQGGGFASNQFLRNLGMSSEAQSQQGVQNFNQMLPTLASTQIDPSLQYEISNQNAINAAAPDPRMAAQEQLRLMQEMYQMENPSTQISGNILAGAGGTMLPGTSKPIKPDWMVNRLYV
jgi:hypothetical protein